MTSAVPGRLAYLRPSTLAAWSAADTRAWAATAAQRGVDGVITKLDKIDDVLREAAARHGIEVIGAFAAYSDHTGSMTSAPIRPVGPDGAELSPLEWYHGIVPGDPTFDDALVAKFAHDLDTAPTRTVFLDFLRWPGHWETESRGGGSPRSSSFDPGTLARFAAWLCVDEVTPADVSAYAGAWEDFRVETVNRTASRLARVARDRGIQLGAFLVPLRHRVRRAQYGQDAVGLAASVDVFAVMTYQQIAGLDAAMTLDLTDEVKSQTGRGVIAMLQTSTAPSFTGGWDWGPPLDRTTVLRRAQRLDDACRSGRLDAICCFPGEAPLPDFTPAPHPEGTV